jgi:hypothetical protein
VAEAVAKAAPLNSRIRELSRPAELQFKIMPLGEERGGLR